MAATAASATKAIGGGVDCPYGGQLDRMIVQQNERELIVMGAVWDLWQQ